jgi:hypothetical protein
MHPFGSPRETAFLRDGDKISELMDLHRHLLSAK